MKLAELLSLKVYPFTFKLISFFFIITYVLALIKTNFIVCAVCKCNGHNRFMLVFLCFQYINREYL